MMELRRRVTPIKLAHKFDPYLLYRQTPKPQKTFNQILKEELDKLKRK